MVHNWIRNYGFGLLALASVYCVVGWLGIQLAVPPGYATAVFPASGTALAALLIRNAKLWPGIILGSLGLNSLKFWISFHQLLDFSAIEYFPISLAIGSGATFEALVALWFIHHWIDSDNPFNRVKNVLGFLVFAAASSSTLSRLLKNSICLSF